MADYRISRDYEVNTAREGTAIVCKKSARGAIVRALLKAVCCVLVLGLPFCWLDWSDHVVGPNGQRAMVIAADPDAVYVRHLGRGTGESHTIESLPRGEIRRWIPGIASMIRRVDAHYVGVALLVHLATTILVGWRWSMLMSGIVARVRAWDAVVWHMRATAADLLGAGQVGLEACRLGLAGKRTGDYAGSIVVQAVERCFGLLALVILVLIGICFSSGNLYSEADVVRRYAVAVIVLCAIAGPVGITMARRIGALSKTAVSGSRFRCFIRRVVVAGATTARRPSLAARTLALSFAVHLSVIANHYVLSLGLGLDIGIVPFVVAVPIVSLALALPITIAGLGVFEGTMVLTLTSLSGVSPSEVLVLCALHRATSLLKRLFIVASLWLPTTHTRSDKTPTAPSSPKPGALGHV